MQLISLLILNIMLGGPHWQPDFETAKNVAQKEHRLILVNFSGSDWCSPCIRMHKDIFESVEFNQFADISLAMVNADFPRLKAHQLPPDQQKKNEQLADAYNPQGKFPFTVLLDESGKSLKSWEGYPAEGLSGFVETIKSIYSQKKP
ncbi:thioredoxin family protein [Flavihumibacter petaseus]|uniref:Thioredoxin domain-containing protein n=1 Tax=Flavihumibacter petaseus NBRC 106054 TaxID=1220578 RepID=A0A0E9N5U8_9BACT|nr:thioredoxin family protein [Flavihumibacter petaseus]GAO45178.1 hypothetical protein FPE01S_04_04220 [Flavihumibacter petaseus NBRC 106054]